jgi:PAS domain S-box-containing protein
MTDAQNERYQDELRRFYHHRIFYILMVAMVLFLSFALLDYFFVPSLFFEFLQYRFAVSFFYMILLYLNFRDVDLQHTFVITFVAYCFSLLALDLMVVRMGVDSSYFAGFIVAIVVYTAMAPLTMIQTLISGFAGVLLYLLSILFWCPLSDGQESILVNNVFFISSFALLVSVHSWYETKSRRESFFLRIQEEDALARLKEQAEVLEREVARRTEERQRREHRFQMLFEYIIDDVILVDKEGWLLYANTPFFEHLGLVDGDEVNLNDLVSVAEQRRLYSDMLAPVARGEVVTGFQTRFFTVDGESLDVEINGNILERQSKVLGLQLIIRDISVRKQMEQELRQSLLMKKQTENATIMALARLSEYRDITPNNHLERIREYTRLLGEELSRRPECQNELGGNTVPDLFMASVLHDIGMVGMPDTILFKDGNLTDEEQEQIRQHTVLGGDVIKAMETSDETSGFLKYAKSIAYFHHEKWDGSGYPFGFIGNEIPLPARIVSLADAYEEMTCESGYGGNGKKSHQQAVNAIIEGSGHAFDPMVVDAFLALEDEFARIREALMPETDKKL